MKIDEIISIGSQPNLIIRSNVEYLEPVDGTFVESFQLYATPVYDNILYGLDIGGDMEFLCLMGEDNSELTDKPALRTIMVYLDPAYRGKGILEAFYFTLRNSGHSIISDDFVSIDAMKTWKRFHTKGLLKVIDTSGEHPVKRKSTIGDFSDNEDINFLLESRNSTLSMNGMMCNRNIFIQNDLFLEGFNRIQNKNDK